MSKFLKLNLTFFISFFFSLFFLNNLHAQVLNILPYSLNQEPGQFYYIENDLVKIVFKKEYQARAFRALHSINTYSKSLQSSFKHVPQKVTIILRSKTMQSNGFVALAPFKSEFFDAPYLQGQLDLGEWMEMLAIHEYRHVLQFSQRVEGFSKFMYWFMGEFGLAIFNVWSTPIWVYEGDATRAETMYTKFGRGRNASFSRRFRALLSRKDSSELTYEDLYFNTPYRFIPDFYKFGYFFIEYLSTKYSFNAEVAFGTSSGNSYNPYAYLNLIEQTAGKNIDTLITEFINYHKKRWESKEEPQSHTQSDKRLSHEDKYDTDYTYPFVNSENELVTLKSGIADIRQLSSKGKALHYPGSFVSRFLNDEKDTLYWVEPRMNIRYNAMSSNAICSLNTLTQKQDCFTLSGRETSFDALEKLAVVSIFDGRASFKVLDMSETQPKVIDEYFAEENSVIINPQFKSSSEVVYIYKSQTGKFSIKLYNFKDKTDVEIFSSDRAIRRHRLSGDKVYFEAELTSIEEIYEIDLLSKQLRRLTNSNIASLFPFVRSGNLYYSKMTSSGLKVYVQKLEVDFKNNLVVDKTNYVFTDKAVEAKPIISSLGKSAVEKNAIKVREFDDDVFNFHSWLLVPPLFSPSFTLSAVSENVSETIEVQTGVSYLSTEGTGGLFAQASFKKNFVLFDVGASFNKRASSDFIADKDEGHVWDEHNIFLGPKVALQWNWGRWISSFSMGTYLNQIEIKNRENTDLRDFSDGKIRGGVLSTNFTLASANNRLRPYSPFSFGIDYTLKDLKSDNDSSGELERGKLSTLKSFLTLGLNKTTGLRFGYGHEVQLEDKYRFISQLNQARGFYYSYSSEFEVFQFDIKRPIVNAQLRLGEYAFFNRFDIGLFHDKMNYSQTAFSSTGFELTTNLYAFRTIPAPIGIGVRYLKRDVPSEFEESEDPTVVEFFLSSITTF